MRKILSLALSFALSSLSLVSLLAAPARAQQVASAGSTISDVRTEYEKFLAIERDPGTSAEVKQLNRNFLDERRARLRELIKSRLDALRKYKASAGSMLKADESLAVEKNIGDLEAEMESLRNDDIKGQKGQAPARKEKAVRPSRVVNSPAAVVNASAPAESAPPAREAAGTKAAPEPKPAPRQDDPIEISAPSDDITTSVDKVELEISVNDEAIDDVMVSVYAGDAAKPFGARLLTVKRSDKGKKKVGIGLRRGENRVEVTSSQLASAKATRTITYAPTDVIGAQGDAGGSGGTTAGAQDFSHITDPEERKRAAARSLAPPSSQTDANASGQAGANNLAQVGTKTETPPEYDWGRARAYFAGGAVFSKERDDFSNNDIFLDFTLDKTYLTTSKENRGFLWAKEFNTFFNARMTSIPVAQPTPDPSASPAPTPTASPTPPCNSPECENFITSRKAAMMQAGIYIPMHGKHTSWVIENQLSDREVVDRATGATRTQKRVSLERNALFIAPLFKGGVQTITNDTATGETDRFGRDDIFNFFSLGFMVGHFRIPTRTEDCELDDYRPDRDTAETCKQYGVKLSRNRNYAPELLSWLTISRGRWESFENRINTGKKDLEGNDIFWRSRPWRWEALGRLKIPSSPFIIGFDGNFGPGPDDLRFLFGTRFDFGKVMSALNLGGAARQSENVTEGENNRQRERQVEDTLRANPETTTPPNP